MEAHFADLKSLLEAVGTLPEETQQFLEPFISRIVERTTETFSAMQQRIAQLDTMKTTVQLVHEDQARFDGQLADIDATASLILAALNFDTAASEIDRNALKNKIEETELNQREILRRIKQLEDLLDPGDET
ncbi:MAG: hypothetical protein KDD60_10955, partial [Bdellovibrionales bacterium]|nr:hypothetical protein [Bdellovibrionales bacterium]